LLDIRNFRIENNTHLSKAYIQYFNTILSKLRGSVDSKNKMLILANDRKTFYNQLKKIYWMREKGDTYDTIIKTPEL
jgi:hypothetical protein